MDRRERDHNERNNYRQDHGHYEGYRADDAHYHSARNLTNEFERDYAHGNHRWESEGDQHRSSRSFHEGNRGNAYERNSREGGTYRGQSIHEQNRNDAHSYSSNPDRLRNYRDDVRRAKRMDRMERDDDRGLRGNIRQGYGISGFDGTSDRFNTLNSEHNRGGAGDEQPYYGNSGGGYRNSSYGSGLGESFPGSNRGVPDTTYGHGNYYQNEGSGMGSTYGGSNYGGGTGYSGGHRGGSFGNESYGTSSGNYSGSGSLGGGTYGGRGGFSRDSTSHNSDRGTTELGGF